MELQSDRRKYKRLDVELQGRFSKIGFFNRRSARTNVKVINVSQNGLFLETKKVLPVGSVVVVDFFLRGDNNHVRAEGVVCWALKSQSGINKGMGIQFISSN